MKDQLEEEDEYGNTESNFRYCCFPNCGCDGARRCMAPSGANDLALTLNLEKRRDSGRRTYFDEES
jgi:hypothetical protein